MKRFAIVDAALTYECSNVNVACQLRLSTLSCHIHINLLNLRRNCTLYIVQHNCIVQFSYTIIWNTYIPRFLNRLRTLNSHEVGCVEFSSVFIHCRLFLRLLYVHSRIHFVCACNIIMRVKLFRILLFPTFARSVLHFGHY